ncbi:MAG: tetratricopeptide repeat protein [Clostridia bacterium]|nr:MAG: tetratricopeptide repeat protein [Clostridia bacterium]
MAADKVEILVQQAWKALTAKKSAEAEAILRQGLEDFPGDQEIMATLAEVKLRQRHLAEAGQLAEAVLRQHPQHGQALYVLGEIHRQKKEYVQAVDYLEAAARASRSWRFRRQLAQVYLDMGEVASALEVLRRHLEEQPQDTAAQRQYAYALKKQGDKEEALEHLNVHLTEHGEDKEAYRAYVQLVTEGRPPEQVVREVSRLLRLPDRAANPHLHVIQADALYRLERYEEALQAAEAALALAPDNAKALKWAGLSLYRLQRYAEAIRYLTACLEAEPGDNVAHNTLRSCYKATGDLAAGLSFLYSLAERFPGVGSLWTQIRHMKQAAGAEPEAGKGR